MFSVYFSRAQFVLGVMLGFSLLVGCGDSNEGGNGGGAKSEKKAGTEAFKFPKKAPKSAIGYSEIPTGTYELKQIRNTQKTKSTENANWSAIHRLDKFGEFDSGNQAKVISVDWKDLKKDLPKDVIRYTYTEFNIPMTIVSDDKNDVTMKDRIYYYNKVQTNSKKLSWAADTSNIDKRTDGTKFESIFILGSVDDDYMYTAEYTSTATNGKGLVILDGKDLIFAFEYTKNKGLDNESTIMVEYVYQETK